MPKNERGGKALLDIVIYWFRKILLKTAQSVVFSRQSSCYTATHFETQSCDLQKIVNNSLIYTVFFDFSVECRTSDTKNFRRFLFLAAVLGENPVNIGFFDFIHGWNRALSITD